MTRWKYDADQRDPLVSLRIPVTSMWPAFGYFAVFDRRSPQRPTRAEALMIASYIEYYKYRWYPEHLRDQLGELPFDIDPGVHSVIFHKYAVGDWGYRRSNWRLGSVFTPPSPRVGTRTIGPLTLLQLLDLVHDPDPGQSWVVWKGAHPDIFPEGEGEK